MSKKSPIRFFDPDEVPIESKIAHFDHPPTDEELAACLGDGIAGGENKFVEDEQTLIVLPSLIPVKIGAIWMYFVLAVMAMIPLFYPPAVPDPVSGRMFWGMLLMGALFIIPAMSVILSMLNDMVGEAPYLKMNKRTDTVELPRVQMTLPKSQLRTIVFLDRFMDGIRFRQVALLYENQNKWNYVHLYNVTESGTGVRILGHRGQYEQLAEHLGIGVRHLNFNRKESELLDF